MSFRVIFADFVILGRFIDFFVILLIIFTIFIGHQNPGPGYEHMERYSIISKLSKQLVMHSIDYITDKKSVIRYKQCETA